MELTKEEIKEQIILTESDIQMLQAKLEDLKRLQDD